jgi:hypothetical protein
MVIRQRGKSILQILRSFINNCLWTLQTLLQLQPLTLYGIPPFSGLHCYFVFGQIRIRFPVQRSAILTDFFSWFSLHVPGTSWLTTSTIQNTHHALSFSHSASSILRPKTCCLKYDSIHFQLTAWKYVSFHLPHTRPHFLYEVSDNRKVLNCEIQHRQERINILPWTHALYKVLTANGSGNCPYSKAHTASY